jgi:hypothetical protein
VTKAVEIIENPDNWIRFSSTMNVITVLYYYDSENLKKELSKYEFKNLQN